MTELSTPVAASTEGHDLEQLHNIVQDLLQQAKSLGASSAEAAVSSESGFSVSVRKGDVETIEYNRDKGLGVTVYFDHRKGSASTSDFKPQSIRDAVRAACDIARYTAEDPCAGLADAALLAKAVPDLQLHHPWTLEPEQAVELALGCEQAAFEVDSRLSNSEGAYVSTHSGQRVYANSHGFFGGYSSSRHSLGCTMIGEQDGQMQRDHWYTLARNPDQLESATVVGQKAGQRTVQRLGAQKMPTCQVPVIFSAEVARGLLGHFVRAISGSSLYRKASFLLDSLGQTVFPDSVTLSEQPHLLQGLGSAPFDSEGVETRARDIVANGLLQGYVLDSYAACQLAMQTTGNAGGVHNLSMNHSGVDLDALLKTMDRGLFITEVMGQGVNIVTGDYSRGASGFWVENGELQYPVEEFTLAGQMAEMFKGIQAIANDLDRRGNLVTGSWLVEQMSVAGN